MPTPRRRRAPTDRARGSVLRRHVEEERHRRSLFVGITPGVWLGRRIRDRIAGPQHVLLIGEAELHGALQDCRDDEVARV